MTDKPKYAACAPFIGKNNRFSPIISDFVIALIPAAVWAVYSFGLRVVTVLLIAVASAIVTEMVFDSVLRRTFSAPGVYSLLTGLLFALCLPATVPFWIPAAGAAAAMLIRKTTVLLLGYELINPVAFPLALILLIFRTDMTSFIAPGSELSLFSASTGGDGVLALDSAFANTVPSVSITDQLLGMQTGYIGQISAVMLGIGALYLLFRRAIGWQIPVAFIGTVAVVSYLFPVGDIFEINFALYNVISGGVLFAAVFLATDCRTSPITDWGKLIFGAGCGLLTLLFRYFTDITDGTFLAVALMSLLSIPLDMLTRPRPFGMKAR